MKYRTLTWMVARSLPAMFDLAKMVSNADVQYRENKTKIGWNAQIINNPRISGMLIKFPPPRSGLAIIWKGRRFRGEQVFPTSEALFRSNASCSTPISQVVESTGGLGNRILLTHGRRRKPVCSDRMRFLSASRCGASSRHPKAGLSDRYRTARGPSSTAGRSKACHRRAARNHDQ